MLAYNVFRTRIDDVYCAVPEDRPIPSFVVSRAWDFTGKLDEHSPAKLPRSFKVAVCFNGFYIFHPFEAPKLVS